MHNSRRFRKYLSVDTTRTLIHAFIMGRVDFCDRDGGAGRGFWAGGFGRGGEGALTPHF